MSNTNNKNNQCVPIRSDFLPVISGIKYIPEFIKFVSWYATPSQFKEPSTQKEFAQSVGVCEDTITDWKRHPQFWTLVSAALAEWIKERIPDAIGGLYEKILIGKGGAKEVELFLKLGGTGSQSTKKRSSK